MALSKVNDWIQQVMPGDNMILGSPQPGNWLVCFLNWRSGQENVTVAASVGDWARNGWTLVASTTTIGYTHNVNASLYSQIWVCPNAQYAGFTQLAIFGAFMQMTAPDITSVGMEVFEISGMTNGYLTVDSVLQGTATGTTSLTFNIPAPAGGADCLMLTTMCGNVLQTPTVTGTFNPGFLLQNSAPAFTCASAWGEYSTAQAVTWATSATQNWCGVAAAIHTTGNTPTITNLNWPRLDFQLGLGYNLSTPLSAVTWTTLPNRLTECDHERGIQFELGLVQSSPTDLTLRNDDGVLSPRTPGSATATSSGTASSLNCTASDASDVTVGDFFQLTNSSSVLKELTVFQVTSIVTVGTNATINFTRADQTGNALVSTATGDKFFACPIDLYVPYRIQATWQGKVYPVVTGWIERWPQQYDDPHWGDSVAVGIDSIATLTAQDYSPLMGEILRRNPHSYWPCGDSSGATQAQNIAAIGRQPLVQTASSHGTGAAGTVAFGVSSQNVNSGLAFAGSPFGAATNMGDPGTQWAVSGLAQSEMSTQGWALVGNDSTFPAISGGVTIFGVMLINVSDAALIEGAGTSPTVCVLSNTLGSGFHGRVAKFAINNSNTSNILHAQYEWWNSSSGTGTTTTTGTIGTGGATFLTWAMVLTTTSWILYLGGSDYSGVTVAGSGSQTIVSNFDRIDVGGEADSINSGECFNGQHSHIAIFPRLLTVGEITDLSSTLVNGYVTSATGIDETIARKLNTIGWKGPRCLTYTNTFGGVEIVGSSMADKVTQLADYNADKLFSDAAGYLQYRARVQALTQTVKAVLGDRPDLGEIPYVGDASNFEIDFDPTYVYNNITVLNQGLVNTSNFFSRSINTTVVVNSNTSIAKYGYRSLNKTVSFTSDTYTAGVANHYLSLYANPQLRVSQVVLDAASNNNVMSFVLSVEVGDYVVVNKRSIGAPMQSIRCVVLDIKHTIKANQWDTTITLGAGSGTLNANPSFTTTVSPWAATGGTVALSTAHIQANFVNSALLTPSGSAASSFIQSEFISVIAGVSYVVGAGFYSPVGYASTSLSVNWFDGNGNFLSTSSNTQSIAANTWTYPSNTFTAPSNAKFATLIPGESGTPPATALLYISDISMVVSQ